MRPLSDTPMSSLQRPRSDNRGWDDEYSFTTTLNWSSPNLNCLSGTYHASFQQLAYVSLSIKSSSAHHSVLPVQLMDDVPAAKST